MSCGRYNLKGLFSQGQILQLNTKKGFSLVELMVVIGIIGVMASVAVINLQRYTNNTNLKNMARDIASDFQSCKAKAISESRNYQVSFTTGTSSSYTISAPATTLAAVNKTKLATDFGGGLQIVFEGACSGFLGTPTNVIIFQTRGTSNNGCVKLTNSIGSTATITTNVTGKAYVIFAMQ